MFHKPRKVDNSFIEQTSTLRHYAFCRACLSGFRSTAYLTALAACRKTLQPFCLRAEKR